MSRLPALAMMGALVAFQSFAGDVPPSPKRQVLNCMVKQMATNKAISYNDASKLCRDQVKAQSAMLADAIKPNATRDDRSVPANR